MNFIQKMTENLGWAKKQSHGEKIARIIGTPKYKQELRESYLANCYPFLDETADLDDTVENDVEQHLVTRMLYVEERLVPWLADVYDISGKNVLEIGCGTGCMTVPIALRARRVFSCDIWDTIKVAEKRAELFDCKNIDFLLNSKDWASSEAGIDQFLASLPEKPQVVTLYAVLEHLTIAERLNLLRKLWDFLPIGGILLVFETPNRLYYYDSHSYLVHFFHFLPDELAAAHARKFSPRQDHIALLYKDDWQERLYRAGRGVSYHEFELAIDFNNFTVLTDGISPLLGHRKDDEYCELLKRIFTRDLPRVPLGFTQEWINLVIRKDA